MINWCHLGDVHFHPRSQFSQGGRMDSVSWPSWQLLMAWSAGGRDFPIDLSWASHGFTSFLSMFVGVSLWISIYWIEMFIVYSLSIYVDICIVFSLWISFYLRKSNRYLAATAQFAFVGTCWQTPGRRGDGVRIPPADLYQEWSIGP